MQVNIQAKHFTNHHVLSEVNFDLPAGEVVALLGPSGIGKSTILHILSGLDTQYQGCIVEPAEQIGFCFQEPRLLPWLSVRANLTLVCDDNVAIDSILNEMGLSDAADTLCQRISLGMARRIALARALLVRPQLLLLDEPFASLDKARAKQLLHYMAPSVRQRDCATIIVTHEPAEAVALSDRLLVLSGQPARIVREIRVNLTEQARHDVDRVMAFISEHDL